jgi:hypothetical protein
MHRVFLVCALALSSLSAAIAGENGRPFGPASKDDMSMEAAYNDACSNAFALTLNSYSDHSPLTDRAVANIKMCNGHPNRVICEITTNMMVREYGKSPQTCGTDTVASVPAVFPNEVARSLK